MPAEPGGPPQLTVQGRTATITLQRPAHHNRLHREDLLALQQHFAALGARPDLRVLVLTGAGSTFSSGFHLGEIAEHPGAAATDPRLFEHTVDALAALPLPSIARLNGGVFGGATDLALACDFRVGGPAVTLRMPAARLGLHYYPGGLRRAVARLGLATAKRLFLLAQTLDAATLHRLGWLDVLAEPDMLDEEVQRLAESLAAAAPLAVQGMKASLDEIALGVAAPEVLRGREARCAASQDLREGLAATREKRQAVFSGR
jgi:enoyl-CoA hydratase